jgi:hypothetical protein
MAASLPFWWRRLGPTDLVILAQDLSIRTPLLGRPDMRVVGRLGAQALKNVPQRQQRGRKGIRVKQKIRDST